VNLYEVCLQGEVYNCTALHDIFQKLILIYIKVKIIGSGSSTKYPSRTNSHDNIMALK